MAAAQLKKEFREILTRGTVPINVSSLETEGTTSFGEQERYHMANDEQGNINHLRSIVEKMNSLGCLCDCVEVYTSLRKSFLRETFKELNIKSLSAGDIRGILLKELKIKIMLWIRAATVCVRFLFRREKIYAQHIFEGLGTVPYEEYFLAVVKEDAINLFKFARALTTACRSTTMLCKIVHLYGIFLDLWPDFIDLFHLESAKAIRNYAVMIKSLLEEVVQRMLPKFEHEIVKEISNISDHDKGGLHSFTKYVMDYIDQILRNDIILTRLIMSKPPMSFGDFLIPDLEFVQREGRTPLEDHLVLIIVVLRYKLEAKSRYYKEDASLVHLFTMNNVDYIVQRIKLSPKLQAIIGDVYTNMLCEYVRHERINYLHLTCDKLLYSLRRNMFHRITCFSVIVSKSTLRKRVETFNAIFEDFKLTQFWVELDFRIKEDLCIFIAKKLIPAYKSFLERFKSHREIYIKYSVEDLETLSIKWCENVVQPTQFSFEVNNTKTPKFVIE